MARTHYDFPEDIGFQDAARVAILASFGKMMDHFAATRAGLEAEHPTAEGIEALKGMRVGSRRLRAALSIFAKLFPADEYKLVEKQVKSLTAALGEVRDLDVLLESLSALNALPPNETYGIERLRARLVRQRTKRRKALLVVLLGLERDKFEKRFLRLVERALPAPDTDKEPTDG